MSSRRIFTPVRTGIGVRTPNHRSNGGAVKYGIYLVSVLSSLAAVIPAEGATIFVTTTEQKINGMGGCSLQEAIYSANFDFLRARNRLRITASCKVANTVHQHSVG